MFSFQFQYIVSGFGFNINLLYYNSHIEQLTEIIQNVKKFYILYSFRSNKIYIDSGNYLELPVYDGDGIPYMTHIIILLYRRF